MLVIARREQGDRAFVVRRARVAVNLLVELWQTRQNKREKNRADAPGGNDRPQRNRFAFVQTHAHPARFCFV
jgi:hypothetical protein